LSQWNLDLVDDEDFYSVDDMMAGETCSAWSCHFTTKYLVRTPFLLPFDTKDDIGFLSFELVGF
jgi:hypothetical protein